MVLRKIIMKDRDYVGGGKKNNSNFCACLV